MKNFLVIFSILTTSALAENSDWIAGKSFDDSNHTQEYEQSRHVCANAPNGAKYCTTSPGCSNAGYFQCHNGYAINPIPCPETAKYCSAGSCVSVPPSGCFPEFTCPGPGNYPKYNDCYTYYHCYFDQYSNSLRYTYKFCPYGYAFNPMGPQGQYCRKNSTCVTASCTPGELAEWRPLNYPGFTQNQIALYCTNGQPNHLDSCLPGQSLNIDNVSSRDCSLICTEDYQTAVYSGDRKFYYLCLGGTYYLNQCNDGEEFDGNKLSCELTNIGTPTETTEYPWWIYGTTTTVAA